MTKFIGTLFSSKPGACSIVQTASAAAAAADAAPKMYEGRSTAVSLTDTGGATQRNW